MPVALTRWTIYPLRILPIRIVRATKPRLPPPGFLCDRVHALIAALAAVAAIAAFTFLGTPLGLEFSTVANQL
jgi:hypothetical protein